MPGRRRPRRTPLVVLVVVFALVATACTGWAWGANTAGQLGLGDSTSRSVPSAVDGLPQADWVSIDAGFLHTCGIRDDSSLWCWGDNSQGQLGDGTTTDRLVSNQTQVPGSWATVSAGTFHTCAVDLAGTLYCWGGNFDGQLGIGSTIASLTPVQAGPAGAFSSVSAGGSHTCAVTTAADIVCWGSNFAGQLGTGDMVDHFTPFRGFSGSWSAVVAGDTHSCAVRTDSTLWCWGNNTSGEIGDGTSGNLRLTPTQVGTASDWTEVVVGAAHTCGLRSGQPFCWGLNGSGQVGDGTGTDRSVPTAVSTLSDFDRLAAGPQHTCAGQTGGSVSCWGSNSGRQLGDGTVVANQLSPSPVLAPGPRLSSILTAGFVHTCALSGSTLWCWGSNSDGQLGDGSRDTRPLPTPIEPDWLEIAAGGLHTCRIRRDNALFCVGENTQGQLGIGVGPGDRSTYARVGNDTDWKEISAGAATTCGIRFPGVLRCWGDNSFGQVGDGTTTSRTAPVQVGFLADRWSMVAVGVSHSCGVRTGGTLWCWGLNGDGQLGDGTRIQRLSPRQVGSSAFDNWRSVDVGLAHTCGIRDDDTLWCWGQNMSSQLGLVNFGADELVPVEVMPGSRWRDVSVGLEYSCAIRTDGTLWCWGANGDGQLGDGTFANHILPAQVGTATSWSVLSAGDRHSCAVGSLLGLWCWGDNSSGQIGDNTTTDRPTPTQVGIGGLWVGVAAGGAHTTGFVL
jgi:alpha-tubulin suppressor-like RCC1 family protein